jgi:glycosyltransferase involved in cell wall biosynthesis
MKILFIAMSESIHTARWIKQIADQDWEIHLFPSIDYGLTHPDLKNVSIYHSAYRVRKNDNPHVIYHGIPVFSTRLTRWIRGIMGKISPDYRANQLKKIIADVKPDIIHSLEFQASGYLTLKVKKMYGDKFPLWIASNWGSDISYFSRFPEHKGRIQEILEHCDYYSCECERDIALAKKLGLKGKILPVLPNAGGFDLEAMRKFRQPGKISERHIILLKGYQGWSGRALVGLRALELCADCLQGFRVVIFSASPEMEIAAELFSDSTKIPVTIMPPSSHENILKLFGKARISIGLGISDGAANAMLEAIVMGAFPIQSNTSCANEWIEDGISGFITPPEDPDIIASAIRKAIIDDNLVDNAARINEETAKKNLDYWLIRQKVIELYTKLVTDKH